jgi:ubiquitin C-terminal hydrolase
MKYREIPVVMYHGTEYSGEYLAYASKQRKWFKYKGCLNFTDVKQRIMIPMGNFHLLDLVY